MNKDTMSWTCGYVVEEKECSQNFGNEIFRKKRWAYKFKKFWQELIAYFLCTVILVSNTASRKNTLVYMGKRRL
jgi:hypothetical protein